MKLLDVNIWVALAVSNHVHHSVAESWLSSQEQAGSIVFCRPTQQGFLRILNTASIINSHGITPMTNKQAWGVYEMTMSDFRVTFAPEPPALDETWKTLALRKTASPKLWMDAYLAAFAIRSGFQLVSADKAFSQFKGLDFHQIGGA